jgi:hypothetical protein
LANQRRDIAPLTELKSFHGDMANFSPGGKSQPGLKRSSFKMELFRFFEEFKILFMSII